MKKIFYVIIMVVISLQSFSQDIKNSVFVGIGSTVGGPIGVGYERVIVTRLSAVAGISFIPDSYNESFGFGIGLRITSENRRLYGALIYGTGSHYETGGSLHSKNYLQGISVMGGYRFFVVKRKFSIDPEIGFSLNYS
ncbi:MAG: hypothetical protein K0B08_08490 [Bacteroidales bacterium]|nr:hypothetical protein [Bacteroidales bacterium]